MHDSSPTLWDSSGNLEVLTFDLGEEAFALEASLVREIIDLLPETVVPGAAPLVGSVVNFRGKIIPIADLRIAFGMAASEATVDSRIIVIDLNLGEEPIQIGVRTDKVHEVATLHRDASEPAPAVGLHWRREYVRELVRRAEGVVVLPDLAAIFNSSGSVAAHPSTLR